MDSGASLPELRSHCCHLLPWVGYLSSGCLSFHILRSGEINSVCHIRSWGVWYGMIMPSPRKCVTTGWLLRRATLFEWAPGRDPWVYYYLKVFLRLMAEFVALIWVNSVKTWLSALNISHNILVIISKLPYLNTFSYLVYSAVGDLGTIYIFSHTDCEPGHGSWEYLFLGL